MCVLPLNTLGGVKGKTCTDPCRDPSDAGLASGVLCYINSADILISLPGRGGTEQQPLEAAHFSFLLPFEVAILRNTLFPAVILYFYPASNLGSEVSNDTYGPPLHLLHFLLLILSFALPPSPCYPFFCFFTGKTVVCLRGKRLTVSFPRPGLITKICA